MPGPRNLEEGLVLLLHGDFGVVHFAGEVDIFQDRQQIGLGELELFRQGDLALQRFTAFFGLFLVLHLGLSVHVKNLWSDVDVSLH